MNIRAFTDWKHLLFAYPWFFLLLLLIPAMIWWQARSKRKNPTMRVTTLEGIKKLNPGFKARFRPILFILRIIAMVALVICLARPQSSNTTTNSDTQGIDIVISMDISGSMLAEDFKPNRIEAAKTHALEFIDKRPDDRIGLVIYSGESRTLCPITIDHRILKDQLMQVKNGMVQDGTSIGMGLATAVDRLRYSKSKSKIIILMTDGVDNMGRISPGTALEIAKTYKLRVYTIGIGTHGQAPIALPSPNGGPPQKVMMPVDLDENLLKKIADQTGGKYFRATDNKTLQGIYEDIDKLEKSNIEVTSYKRYTELFFPFAFLAILCITLELLLRYTVFKSIT